MERSEQDVLAHPGKSNEDLMVFVGDALALDAVNTERLVKGVRRDLLMSPEALAHWWRQAQQHYPTLESEQGNQAALTVDQEVLDTFKVLRRALRRLFEEVMAAGEIHEEDLAVLNDILKMRFQVLEQTTPGSFRLRDLPDAQSQAQVLLPIVHSAIWLLIEGSRSRLHTCHNPRCRLFFYDRTRSATRQWCHLKCMDRARSAQRYQHKSKSRQT